MITELRDMLFLDIETVATTRNFSQLDERIKVQWSRKASFLKRTENQTDEDLYHERAGIYAEFGKIVCIAVGKFADNDAGETVLRTRVYSGHTEHVILTEFKSMLERLDQSSLKLCAHNGKEFDFPYLCRRMLINNIAPPAALNLSGKKSWEIHHMDTLEMWKFGDYKHYTSLDLLAAVFNIASSKGEMDGGMVNMVYHDENNLDKIRDYCVRDIVVLARLFLRLRCINLPAEFSVHYAE